MRTMPRMVHRVPDRPARGTIRGLMPAIARLLRLFALILAALQRDALFFSAALPRRIFNPLFNRYGGSRNHFVPHIDNAVLRSAASGEWVRSDLSCTVFLSEPDEYEGGELQVQDTFGSRGVKLAAGDAVLYPGTSVHAVTPVTRGVRLASADRAAPAALRVMPSICASSAVPMGPTDDSASRMRAMLPLGLLIPPPFHLHSHS